MFDRNIVLKTAERVDQTRYILGKSQALCRESRTLIDASRDIINNSGVIWGAFSDFNPDTENT